MSSSFVPLDPPSFAIRGPKIEFRPPKVNLPISAVPGLCVAEPSPRAKELAEFLFAEDAPKDQEEPQIPTEDKVLFTGSDESVTICAEVCMPDKKSKGRPRVNESGKMDQKVSTMLLPVEKERLDEIAASKKWPLSTLLRDCIEQCYPQVFGKDKK